MFLHSRKDLQKQVRLLSMYWSFAYLTVCPGLASALEEKFKSWWNLTHLSVCTISFAVKNTSLTLPLVGQQELAWEGRLWAVHLLLFHPHAFIPHKHKCVCGEKYILWTYRFKWSGGNTNLRRCLRSLLSAPRSLLRLSLSLLLLFLSLLRLREVDRRWWRFSLSLSAAKLDSRIAWKIVF